MNVTSPSYSAHRAARRYVRPPEPLHFPESEKVPETGIHLLLRTKLFLLVREVLAERGAVGSEQFLYWDPANPRKCLAPDLIVRMGASPDPFPTWKTWERGAPHLAVEIVSPWDTPQRAWRDKLESYRSTGIDEVVRFDPENAKQPLAFWDRFEGDLVERALDDEHARHCDTLGLYWYVRQDAKLGPKLWLAREPHGREPVLSSLEREQQAREHEQRAKEAALARVAELETELRRRT